MYKFVKVAVLCTDSSGLPTIHTCTPEVTAEQYARGEHYGMAKANAADNSFDGPMLAFHQADPAAAQLKATADWFTSVDAALTKQVRRDSLGELLQSWAMLADSASSEGCTGDLTVVDGKALRQLLEAVAALRQDNAAAKTVSFQARDDTYLCHDIAATRSGNCT